MFSKEPLYQYLGYLARSGGRYCDLGPILEGNLRFRGVVLHDEADALKLAKEELAKQSGIDIKDTDPTKRFKSWVVDSYASKRVLLVETGMGSMNASLAAYELAAGLNVNLRNDTIARRILKVGTCSGFYDGEEPGTVLVPSFAINDEGATKWNDEITDEQLEQKLLQTQREKLTEADQELTQDLAKHLSPSRHWWSGFIQQRYEKEPKAAIWSVDNFHGVRHRVEKIYPLIHQYYEERRPDPVPVGFENECSSHFSACTYLDLRIAAALVVSWSYKQVLSLVTTGENTRTEDEWKLVHKTETELIVGAVNYLFSKGIPIEVS